MNSFIVFSDLHNLFNPTFNYWKDFFDKLITSYPNALIISLGDLDCTDDSAYTKYKDRILFLRGNNDDNQIDEDILPSFQEFGITHFVRKPNSLLCDTCIFSIEGLTFFAMHGHEMYGKRIHHPSNKKEWKEYKRILNKIRKENHCDYLLYGHSHLLDYDTIYRLINPGSCNELLCVNEATYLEIRVDKKKIDIKVHTIK